MKKIVQKAGILFLIFAAALVVYFVGAQNTMEKETAIYTSMEEPTLPVVYTDLGGREINCLRGYLQDMGNQAARDSISILPEDRGLNIRVEKYGNHVTRLSYEIRNLTLDRLVERTEVENWTEEEGSIRAVLPIQNLIKRNETYLLTLTLSTGEKSINYYTRIMWPDSQNALEMVNLAETFTRKSLDYDQAKDLVSYLETNDTEDNSSLGHVTIRASFRHLTWDGLDVEMVGEPQVTLQEYDGIMGQIQIRYQVAVNESDGGQFLVDAEDNFTMKWNEQRIYLMNYERNADEIFEGRREAFSGKKIMLGITRDDKVSAKKSPSSQFLAFKADSDLWYYDHENKSAICLFSFRSSKDDGIRSGYGKHDVKILSVRDDGSVDFLVYGYMNRGKYEGSMGAVCYRYDRAQNTVQERFFLPSSQSYEQIREDVETLSYLSDTEMMYLMLGGTVYGIDLKSNESLVVAQGLTKGSFAVSSDSSRMAWQEGQSVYEADKIHVMDFHTSLKQEIVGKEGDYVRVLGFVGDDLIYGLSNASDQWMVNGRLKDMPMYAMYIVDPQMNVESEYRKDGRYITDVQTQDGRIHLKCLLPLGDGQYVYENEDTIVCNQKVEADPLEGIGWQSSQEKGKIYFVQSPVEILGDKLRVSAPKAFSYENTSVLDVNPASQTEDVLIFYAYGGGRYLGASRSFSQAVQMAYDAMGYVTDHHQHIVWDRINRSPIRTIKSPVEEARQMTKYLDSFEGSCVYEDGLIMMDAGGCSLNQMLYYIDKGIPVIAYVGVETGQYVLLSGYDQYNVTFYDPETQETWKMGLNDAAEYFRKLQNDFICALRVE